MLATATEMRSGIKWSITFHPSTLRCEVSCGQSRQHSLYDSPGLRCGLLASRWLASLDKQLQAVELLVKDAFYGRRDLFEAAFNESTDTVGDLDVGIVAAADQLPCHASSNAGRLERSERSAKAQDFARSNVDNAQMFDCTAIG
jgi:hypothetical protein